MKLFITVFLSLTGFFSSADQQNKTKRWLGNDLSGIRYPSAYQQVSPDDSTKSIGASNTRPSTNSYNTPQPLILFTPAAVLEQQEARVRHIYLKPTPSSPPPPSVTTLKPKNPKLEAQPQFHSYSTFILPPQLQSAVVPTTYPIRHQPTAFYGYATVPPATAAPIQQHTPVRHVYLDQKHPVFHYHYQTYPNSKPLVIHNSVLQNTPKPELNQNVKYANVPQKEVNEEVKNREQDDEEEEEVEDAPDKENVRENDNEEVEEEGEEEDEREPAKQQENYNEREDNGDDEKENLEEEDEDDEEEKENLEEEEEEDNRNNHGPQVFYRNNDDDDDEPQQKKRYRNEERDEDEEEEENKRHDVTIKPSFGFDYQRFAEEYKSIQYPKPVGPLRIPIKPYVAKPELKKKVNPNTNAKPYPSITKKPKKIQKPNKKASGAYVNVQPSYPRALLAPKINNIEQQKYVQTNQQQQPQHTVPVIYQRLRNYFTPTPIVNSQ